MNNVLTPGPAPFWSGAGGRGQKQQPTTNFIIKKNKTMKKTITLILCSLFLTAAVAGGQAPTKKNEAEITFDVNIHCHNCKKKIENALPHEKGVVDLKVSLEKKEVWMKYRTDKTTKESLQQAIEKLGYTAAEKKPDKLEIKN
jgi:copper chaperone CopZ